MRTGPTKALKRNLSRYCAVVDTGEFRSSKLCSKCFVPLSDRSADGKVLGWGVRRCLNTECSTPWWHRDVNAARNIGR
jgi:transposase